MTIIVLLILAGVSIATLTGDNGILTKAQTAKTETEKASEEEQIKLAAMNAAMNTENQKYIDRNGNEATIPAGFAPTGIEGEDLINEGLVIIDNKGNEFVWIPVGKVKDNKGNINTIELGRYDFDEQGKKSNYNISTFTEDTQLTHDATCKNTIAKDIEAFKKSASSIEEGGNGGYYIGRYEARSSTERTEESKDNIEQPVIEKPNGYIYNYLTQSQAAQLSRKMYTSDKFTSDLMNSYAWDTAIEYIQILSKENNYSNQISLFGQYINNGTNNLQDVAKQDKVCNIWDLAGNCLEWDTETCSAYDSNLDIKYDVTRRGGFFSNISGYYCKKRSYVNNSHWSIDTTFRPILYL